MVSFHTKHLPYLFAAMDEWHLVATDGANAARSRLSSRDNDDTLVATSSTQEFVLRAAIVPATKKNCASGRGNEGSQTRRGIRTNTHQRCAKARSGPLMCTGVTASQLDDQATRRQIQGVTACGQCYTEGWNNTSDPVTASEVDVRGTACGAWRQLS